MMGCLMNGFKKGVFVGLLLCSMGVVYATEKIVTHALAVIVDLLEDAADPRAALIGIRRYVRDKIPFVVPERLLRNFLAVKENAGLKLDTIRWFLVPRGGYNKVQFYLCYPTDLLAESFQPFLKAGGMKVDTKNLKVSDLEKEHGLLLEHFQEVKPADLLKKLETEEWQGRHYKILLGPVSPEWYFTLERMSKSLRHVVTQLFVPKNFYKKNEEAPRWLLFFSGHGSQYQATSHSHEGQPVFSVECGDICCLRADLFGQMIALLVKKFITVGYLDIETCFGGGINLGCLFFNKRKKKLVFKDKADNENNSPYNFLIGARTVGDVPIMGGDNGSPGRFYKIVSMIELYDKDIDERLGEAYGALATPYVNNIAVYKPADEAYFVEVFNPHAFRIDGRNATLSSELEIKEAWLGLLYATTVTTTLSVDDLNRLCLVSAIPGDTFHTFEKIEGSAGPAFDPQVFIANLFKPEGLAATKLFHFKEIALEHELFVYLKPNTVEAVLCTKRNTLSYTLFEGERDPYVWSLTFSSKKISQKQAEQFIENFEKKRKSLVALAPAQKPYRLLKDAAIDEYSPATKGLVKAVTQGTLGEVKRFLKEGGDPNAVTVDEKPLLVAALGNKAIKKALIEAGAKIKITDESGSPVRLLQDAVKEGDVDFVYFLVDHGADPSEKGLDGTTLLQKAALFARAELIDFFVKKGASVKEKDRFGNTVLAYALRSGSLPIVKKLVEQYGASLVDMDENLRREMLIKAVEDERLKILIYLLTNRLTDRGVALSDAVRSESLELVKELVEHYQILLHDMDEAKQIEILKKATCCADIFTYLLAHGRISDEIKKVISGDLPDELQTNSEVVNLLKVD